MKNRNLAGDPDGINIKLVKCGGRILDLRMQHFIK